MAIVGMWGWSLLRPLQYGLGALLQIGDPLHFGVSRSEVMALAWQLLPKAPLRQKGSRSVGPPNKPKS